MSSAPGNQPPAMTKAPPAQGNAPSIAASLPPAPPAKQPAGKQPPGPPGTPAIQLPRGMAAAAPPPQVPAAQRGPVTAPVLMALGRDRRIMPEDFKIGPLGDARAEKQDESRALAAAGAFLDSLVAGKVDKKLLAPDSQDAVYDTLSFGLRRGNTPTSYRLGTPKTRDDGEVTAPVRLFGSEGTSEGQIYVASTGSAWLVADLQLDLAQLSVKQEKPKEKFFPLEYRWLLEE